MLTYSNPCEKRIKFLHERIVGNFSFSKFTDLVTEPKKEGKVGLSRVGIAAYEFFDNLTIRGIV
jgi:hypothetical protein